MGDLMFVLHMSACVILLMYAFILVAFVKQNEKTGLLIHVLCSALYVYGFAKLSRATTLSEAALAIRVEYIGAIFLAITLLYMLRDYFKMSVPTWIMYGLMFLDMIILFSVLNFEINPYFYGEVVVEATEPYIVLHKTHGILYYANVFSMVFTSGFCLALAVKHFVRRKEFFTYKCWALMLGIFSPIASFVFYLLYPDYDLLSIFLFIADTLFMSLVWSGKMFDVMTYTRKSVLENTGRGFVIVDNKGFVLDSNEEARRIIGDQLKKDINISSIKIPGEEIEYGLYKNDGMYFAYESHDVVHKHKYKGCIINVWDITNEVNEKEHILELSRQANAANEAKSQFLAKMSHEIRTPINTIIGMNEAIMEDVDIAEAKAHAKDIAAASADLMKLVNDLLSYSGVGSGQTADDFVTPVEIGDVDLSKWHILVVDDNFMNCKVVGELMRNTGAHITYAYSGNEAIEFCKDRAYDLIYLDYMMPELDGIETLKLLRADEESLNTNTPVVMLTANVVSGVKEHAEKAGFNDYLSKPITKAQIVNMSRRWLLHEDVEIKASESEENAIAVSEDDAGLLINKEIALSYCEDEDFLLELMQSFVNEWSNKKLRIKECFDNKDWKNYKVLVHGLKNNAMYLGAISLSEQAKAHEFAVRDDDIAFVEADYRSLMNLLEDVIEQAKTMM